MWKSWIWLVSPKIDGLLKGKSVRKVGPQCGVWSLHSCHGDQTVLKEDETIDGDKLLGFFSYATFVVHELTSSAELEGILKLGAVAMDRMAMLVQEGTASDDDFRTASELYLNLHASALLVELKLEIDETQLAEVA